MIEQIAKQAETDCKHEFTNIQSIVENNQKRVLGAFKNNQVSDYHFQSTTGYGYDDSGRDVLEAVYADVFCGEDALVRPQIVSGTHAISTALFGLLRPGDELLYITGKPYDTLEEVIGKRGKNSGSLKDFGILYNEVPLKDDYVDYEQIKKQVKPNTRVIGIQRSKGYDDRPSFTIDDIGKMCRFVREVCPEAIIFLDNCYGEFVEEKEPLEVGVDIIAGSLIKNPGGGIVRAGGYIAGKRKLVADCANRLTAPGLGKETGATLHMLQEMFQGLFLAPHIVGEALKGAVFTSRLLELAGCKTEPLYNDKRTDLIQTVTFPGKDQMIAFCQTIQENSPVNSYVTPIPAEMPGYEDDVIMAAGTFIQGASIELTADGPIRPPYTAFIQGGLTYEHVKIALVEAVKKMDIESMMNEPIN